MSKGAIFLTLLICGSIAYGLVQAFKKFGLLDMVSFTFIFLSFCTVIFGGIKLWEVSQ